VKVNLNSITNYPLKLPGYYPNEQMHPINARVHDAIQHFPSSEIFKVYFFLQTGNVLGEFL
jgi:hypothetical protein